MPRDATFTIDVDPPSARFECIPGTACVSVARPGVGPHREHHSTSRGFTLVELMVVVILLGIITSVVAPRFSGDNEAARTSAAARKIFLSLEVLRSEAVATATAHRLCYSPEARLFWAEGYLPIDPSGAREYVPIDLEDLRYRDEQGLPPRFEPRQVAWELDPSVRLAVRPWAPDADEATQRYLIAREERRRSSRSSAIETIEFTRDGNGDGRAIEVVGPSGRGYEVRVDPITGGLAFERFRGVAEPDRGP